MNGDAPTNETPFAWSALRSSHPDLIRRPELGEIETKRPGRVAHDSLELGDVLALQPAREAHDLDPRLLVDRDAKGHERRSRGAGGEPPMIPIAYITPTRRQDQCRSEFGSGDDRILPIVAHV